MRSNKFDELKELDRLYKKNGLKVLNETNKQGGSTRLVDLAR